ncbi:hypothetical protein CH373_11230 [Leptospira perolatii]|uniref:histidine kinase n=1 Tax=Leptospira perolatii TaxID=2023191 RepID=A0A2M9ZLU7_9LEPT|nr:ATP-binding protein [Leptospira perolatii]PJZ69725.1 hypothetical protein CH360_09005 [Leptospira perolatii]PJZ73060.1 hypothetical protein CH373_11230 [Leptospira perolatii]
MKEELKISDKARVADPKPLPSLEKMRDLVKEMDWSKTPLGRRESWPQSLRTLVELCLDSKFPAVIFWGEHRAQVYNDGYRIILGEKHPKALGQKASDCWSEIWDLISPMMVNVFSSGEAVWVEDSQFSVERNGYLEEAYFTFSYTPVRDESGDVGGIFETVAEVTSQIIAQRRLVVLRGLGALDTSQRLSDICNSIVDLLSQHSTDTPFSILYLLDESSKEAHLCGVSGISSGTAASPKSIDLNRDKVWNLREAYDSKDSLVIKNLNQQFGPLPGGPWPEPSNTAVVIPIENTNQKKPFGFLILGVSPRRELDDNYFDFLKLVAQNVSRLLSAADAYAQEKLRAEKLSEIDQAKTAFFSNVSHEFRTPLTLMLGPIEDALGSHDRTLSSDLLHMVYRNALRLMKLVNSLLDFSRIEAGRVDASYQATDLAMLTSDLASAFRSAIEQAGIKLELDCPQLSEQIYIDHDMWEKIVLNLLSNALKFTFEGSIGVSLSLKGNHAVLQVKDSGVGIPAEELPHLFERFHRIHGAKSRTHEGSGIGLALVNELVKLHGGTIEATSKVNEGTTFTISIPRGFAHLPKENVRNKSHSDSKGRRITQFVEEALRWSTSTSEHHEVNGIDSVPLKAQDKKLRILVADDNADLREYITSLLDKIYEVDAVPDGYAALESILLKKPDLIISDVMMPRLDGFGLLRAVRNDTHTMDVPLILLSARAGGESAIEGLQAGADDYVLKPFSARELIARVKTHIELSQMRQKWTRELEKRTEELAALNKGLDAFSYSVSHDLRAPLRAIIGYSEILFEDYGDKLDPEAGRLIEIIKSGAFKMSRLIDDILTFSRLGRNPISKSDIDMSAIVRNVFDELHGQQGGREIELRMEPLPLAKADRAMIQQVWTNLLSNALKYSSMKPKTIIEVGSRIGDDEPIYYVKDNGVGFDMKYADKLFGVFQRLHGSERFEGTGVGLALVDTIVRRHGGKVWADAKVDDGATFYFSLPAHEDISDATE